MLSQNQAVPKLLDPKIGMRDWHKILSVFLRYVTSFCGIKEECIKRGLGESLDVRICRLVQYDTNNGPDDAVQSDTDDDTLTFLRAEELSKSDISLKRSLKVTPTN